MLFTHFRQISKGNNIETKGWKSLAEGLKGNSTITEIDLGRTQTQ